MSLVKKMCVGSSFFLASAMAWGQYTGNDGGSFDTSTGSGEFISAWIPGTSYSYNAPFAMNHPYNISITGATPVTPGNEGGVYDQGVFIVPNFTVYSGTGSTAYSLAWTYGGLDSKARLTFDLFDATALNLTGNTNAAGCRPPIPITQGESWQATYQTMDSSGPTGTRQMTWTSQGFTTFNNQTAVAVQVTESDASGTSTRTNYYQPLTSGFLKLGEIKPATPTAPLTQKVLTPPPTTFAYNLNVGSSNFYYYTETMTSGSTISTATKISTLTFAGIKGVTTPAGPFSACVFRSMWAENGKPSSVIDTFYDSQTGGLVQRSINGTPVDLVVSYKF